MRVGKRVRIALICCALLTVSLLLSVGAVALAYKSYVAPAPEISGSRGPEPRGTVKGDFYVSTDGSDENDGSEESPFRTLERARLAVRDFPRSGREEIVVCVKAGVYSLDAFSLSLEDGGSE